MYWLCKYHHTRSLAPAVQGFLRFLPRLFSQRSPWFFSRPFLVSHRSKRIVVIKCDGLPPAYVDSLVRERDPRTGKSQLPWIEHVFYQRGTRLANFYVRGLSLSAPSWSLLETGQHLQIKGNVEFDRYTLQAYDYLNFIPFFIARIGGVRVDMPAVEVLDSLATPMLTDAYPHQERYVGMSLFQRGGRLITFQKSLENKFKRGPKELFDEWTMGLDIRNSVPEQLLRDVIEKIDDPKVRYVELVMTDFDHVAHHNNDRESHTFVSETDRFRWLVSSGRQFKSRRWPMKPR